MASRGRIRAAGRLGSAMSRLDSLPRRELLGGLVLCVALSRRSRLLGLAGLLALEPERGLLLPACRSVHTVGMRFALDLVWLDRDRAPIRVDRAVAPGRLRACLRAHSVVEVQAGRGDAFAAGMASAASG